MTFCPDFGEVTQITAGKHVRAVGWLSINHDYTTGNAPGDFVARLREFCANYSASEDELGFGMFCGFHTCEFCGDCRGIGNVGVPAGDLLYVAPEMIHHYVTAHRYLPPAEFVEAVMACPLPGTAEYKRLAHPFREHQAAFERECFNITVRTAAKWAFENGGESRIPTAISCYFISRDAECERLVRAEFAALTNRKG
ncbi:MAG: hypothetical protein AB7G23_12345 [Vicinamibacterales bacterium]